MPSLPPVTLVVVEHDPVHTCLLTRALQHTQLTNPLLMFYNGHEALDYLGATGCYSERHPALPRVLLLNIHLPGLDGLTMQRRLHAAAHTAGIPVIMLNRVTAPQESARCLALGCRVILPRPLPARQLLEALQQLEQERSKHRQSPAESSAGQTNHPLWLEARSASPVPATLPEAPHITPPAVVEAGTLSIVRRGERYQIRYASDDPYACERQPYNCPDAAILDTLLERCRLDHWAIQRASVEMQRRGVTVLHVVLTARDVARFFPLAPRSDVLEGPPPGHPAHCSAAAMG